MPTTLERRAGVQHRRRQIRLTAATLLELQALFGIIDPDNLDRTERPWAAAVTAVVERAHGQSVQLASTYLTVVDEAPVVAAPVLNREALETSLRVTGPLRIEKALRLGAPIDDYLRVVQRETARAAARHASNGGRDLLLDDTSAKKSKLRWRRLVGSKACDFCVMLAGRGAVYHTRTTAGFQAHDGCACYPMVEKVSS